jgi:hypothetical protein
MRNTWCWVCAAVVVTATAVAGGLLLWRVPSQGQRLGGTEVPGTVTGERRRAEKLEALRREVRHREQERQRLLRELLAGRLSLLEAAARFLDLNPKIYLASFFRAQLRFRYPKLPFEEAFCRHVIDHVREADADRRRVARAVRRLEKELAEHLARHGRVLLPGTRPTGRRQSRPE